MIPLPAPYLARFGDSTYFITFNTFYHFNIFIKKQTGGHAYTCFAENYVNFIFRQGDGLPGIC
jgi:hypothetical protein